MCHKICADGACNSYLRIVLFGIKLFEKKSQQATLSYYNLFGNIFAEGEIRLIRKIKADIFSNLSIPFITQFHIFVVNEQQGESKLL